MSPSASHDVIIVGARAAGASTAMLLARRGHRVLLLDRTAHGSDTMSTLAIMRPGVVQLEHWGLVGRLEAAGTPPLHRVAFDYGDRPRLEVPLRRPLYAPRRTVLDVILADAAAEAGAEVHRGVHVTGLLRDDDGVVRGVRARRPDGIEAELGARLVVGADGRNSVVAREVAAPVTRRGTHATAFAYTYVRGMETDGLEWLYALDATAGIVPTNDDEACVFVGVRPDRFHRELRGDMTRAFDRVLAEVSPGAAARAAGAERTAPVRGFPGVPAWLRRPHGRGWALVGDAGYFKDPATAHGITDAMRDAELLVRAADDGLNGRCPMPMAMADYEQRRDRLSAGLFDTTDAIAALDWSFDELTALHFGLSDEMRQEAQYLDALHAADDLFATVPA